jgi:hypothetical protein
VRGRSSAADHSRDRRADLAAGQLLSCVFSAAAGENFTARLAAIWIVSPVAGQPLQVVQAVGVGAEPRRELAERPRVMQTGARASHADQQRSTAIRCHGVIFISTIGALFSSRIWRSRSATRRADQAAARAIEPPRQRCATGTLLMRDGPSGI